MKKSTTSEMWEMDERRSRAMIISALKNHIIRDALNIPTNSNTQTHNVRKNVLEEIFTEK